MMKIKTITCHDVHNFGASLQAHALMKYIENKGHDVEIINYKPDYLSFSLWRIGDKWSKNILLKILYFGYVVPVRILNFGRRIKFSQFNRKYLKLTPTTYKTFGELKLNAPKADVFFAGSDQIWNTGVQNGKDPAFYLDFAPENSIRASYAASFSVSQIDVAYKPLVESLLQKMDFISVREKTGLEILKSFGIDGVHVLDPVFLLNKTYWQNFVESIYPQKYIFVYDQENNEIIKNVAIRIASEQNLKIVTIKNLYPLNYADKKFVNVGPIEFLSLIFNCEICLTNSFHCTAFSLIFEKEVFVFKRTHEKVNSRMIDLLNMVGMSKHIIESENDTIEFGKTDFEMVNSILNNTRKSSEDYIDNVLNFKKL
jgi:hypothetical protein